MKKYFLFDNEPITGTQYFWRVLCGSWLIAFFGLGLWVLAATGFKRAGAFGWKREVRVLAAIFVPINGLAYLIFKMTPALSTYEVTLFDIFAFVAGIFHLVLLFKNGNKKVVRGE